MNELNDLHKSINSNDGYEVLLDLALISLE
jgi:hypothetical protein